MIKIIKKFPSVFPSIYFFPISFLLIAIIQFHCISSQKISIEPGITVEKFTEKGVLKYRIIAIGEASESAIDSGSFSMKQNTSCEASKRMIRSKLIELTGNPTASERLAHHEGTSLIEDARYCEKVYTIDAE